MGWDWAMLYMWINTPWVTLGKTPISLGTIVGLLFILIFVWWFSTLVERALRRVALRHNRDHTTTSTVYAFTRLVRYLVWIVGTVVGLGYIGLDLTNLAFLGGAIGVGIGFGLQNIFSNFISGIIILVEKTLKVGDFVDLQSGVRGSVAEIGMRYTRVVTNDSVDILVPNSEFINGRVTNWTFTSQNRRIRVKFGVAYGTDKDQVREAGLAAAARVAGTIIDDEHEADVWLLGFGDNSLDFGLVVWVGPQLISRPARTEAMLLWALEDELAQRKIEIPFPQRDLHIRSGSLTVQLDPGTGPDGGERADNEGRDRSGNGRTAQALRGRKPATRTPGARNRWKPRVVPGTRWRTSVDCATEG